MRRHVFGLGLLLASAAGLHAQPAALAVNASSREEVRQFYRAIFFASENATMNWTGNYASGSAGDTSAAFKEATRLRINFFRALAGVPADITFNPVYNAKAQQGALLISVNNELNHTPPPTWMLYSAVGAEAAANSNLALGLAGPDAITSYILDSGVNNAAVGHRRWIFYPQTLAMGTGDVPGIVGNNTRRAANAVWVIDSTPGGQFGAPRPATRTTAIPYPPAGFVPYSLVWPRWSFSYPGADFSRATVTMTRDGQPVPVRLEPLSGNIGEPTLVWVYDDLDANSLNAHVRPARDTTYTVAINQVRLASASQNFTYTVTVFDPETLGDDAVPVSVQGPILPAVAKNNPYTVAKPSFAAGFEWRTVQLGAAAPRFTAEVGLEGLLATTVGAYEVVQTTTVAAGNRAYRLAHFEPRSDQILLLPGTYLVDPGAALAFRSRLGISTATETARVQVSTDDGISWSDVFSQAGTSPTGVGFPPSTEEAFVSRTVSLAPFVGRAIKARFVYSIGFGNAFVPNATNAVGWFLDEIALGGIRAVSVLNTARVANGSAFTLAPADAGPLVLQARSVLFGAYPSEWGPLAEVNAIPGEVAQSTSYLSNLSVRTHAGTGAETLIVGFTVSGGTKPLLVRGIGPALAAFGVSGAISDPKLEVYQATARISENDNWLAATAADFSRVGAFGLTGGSRDAALAVSLPPQSYTAQLSGANGETGVALVELYDSAPNATGARLANLSARSRVGSGNDLLIAGFSVAGTGARTLLIRAVGPTLSQFGVSDALGDPVLELHDRNGKIQENDNWDANARIVFNRIGAFDLAPGSRDAVLLATLPPGNYTAQIRGAGNTSGVALIEVYDVP